MSETAAIVGMRPHAVIRAAIILAFLAWVFSSIIPFTQTPKHLRSTDTGGLPPGQLNPRPSLGAPPPRTSMSRAQASDTLRSMGYLSLSGLTQDEAGNWWARGRRQFDGPMLSLELDVHGTVTEHPAADRLGPAALEGAQRPP